MNVDEFRQELDKLLELYIGRLEYGNLTKFKNWPSHNRDSGSYTFKLTYDTCFLSTTVLDLTLNKDGTIKLKSLRPDYSIKGGLKRYEWLIKMIPRLRFKESIRRIKIEKGLENDISFEELLSKESNDGVTEIYTGEELRRIRGYNLASKVCVLGL